MDYIDAKLEYLIKLVKYTKKVQIKVIKLNN